MVVATIISVNIVNAKVVMRAGYIRIGKSSMGDPEGTNLEGYS